MDKLLLTESDASRECGVSVKTLQYWRFSGHPGGIPFIKVGRRVYYRQSDLEQWVADAPTFQSAIEARMHSESRSARS